MSRILIKDYKKYPRCKGCKQNLGRKTQGGHLNDKLFRLAFNCYNDACPHSPPRLFNTHPELLRGEKKNILKAGVRLNRKW